MLIDRVTNVRLPHQCGLHTLRFEQRRIASISKSDPGERGTGTTLDGAGRLIVPSFVDSHVHLDKAFLHGHAGATEATLGAAIASVAALREHVTREEVRGAAVRAIDLLGRHGVTAARAEVEIDPLVGLDYAHLHLALAEQTASAMDLQLAAFPQRGLESPQMKDLMRAAMTEGLTVVGGCPYVDTDPAAHLDFVFDLAEQREAPVDLHLDFSDDAERSLIPLVVERTLAHGMAGRVTIGHVTTLAAMSPDRQGEALGALARADIALVVLPATDLYLAGHGEPGTRSLAPLERARAAGVRVAIANNNLMNPFSPYGNANLLQAAWLTGLIRRASTPAARGELFEAITNAPAGILGLEERKVAVGAIADLALVDAESLDEALLQAASVLATLRGGKLVYRLQGPSVATE